MRLNEDGLGPEPAEKIMADAKNEVTQAVAAAAEKLEGAKTMLEHARAHAAEGSEIAAILDAWHGLLASLHEEVARPIAAGAFE